MENVKLIDIQNVEYLISKRDAAIENLGELLKIGDEKSKSIFDDVNKLNRQIKLGEDVILVKRITSSNIL